jgi:DNA-binding PadR family transcriptional regulator
MAKRRKVGNLLALAVLTSLAERPMHPYEMAAEMRERGKHHSIKINWGSLYTVVQNLEKHGLIAAAGTSRQGRHPERTIYEITPEGRDELEEWLEELLAVPEREYTRFEAALSMSGILPPDRVVHVLTERARILEASIAGDDAALAKLTEGLPRVFVVEWEYRVALAKAELAWIKGLLDDIENETLDGLEEWRKFHEQQ